MQWWNKLPLKCIPDIEGKAAIGLSPRIRFYRYLPGQKFNMHKGAKQEVSGNTTLMTLLIYLKGAIKLLTFPLLYFTLQRNHKQPSRVAPKLQRKGAIF